jgi:hypothetical protein
MKLSLELITESLSDFGAEMHLSRENSFEFTGVQMLPQDTDELSEDILYLCEPKMLLKLNKGLFRNHCFVFQIQPQYLDRCKRSVNYITFSEEYPLSEIMNHLINKGESHQRIISKR